LKRAAESACVGVELGPEKGRTTSKTEIEGALQLSDSYQGRREDGCADRGRRVVMKSGAGFWSAEQKLELERGIDEL
jgi:hypothetical protein